VWSRVVAVTIECCERLVLGKFRLASDPTLNVFGREGLLSNPPIRACQASVQEAEKPLKRIAHLLFYKENVIATARSE
jgi:hypothetical protein